MGLRFEWLKSFGFNVLRKGGKRRKKKTNKHTQRIGTLPLTVYSKN